MSDQELEEKNILETRLDKALEEAWSKVNKALAEAQKQSGEWEMSIRLAAEALEYSSALFSLTYELEDFDPEVTVNRKADAETLVADSVEELRRARETRSVSTKEAYTSLRKAADYLKSAYLSQLKKSGAKRASL